MSTTQAKTIENIICKVFTTEPKILRSGTRVGMIPTYRHVTFYFIKKYLKESDRFISEFYEIERSSVNVGVNKIKKILKSDDYHPLKQRMGLIDTVLSKHLNFETFLSNFILEISEIENELQFAYYITKYNNIIKNHDYET